MPSKKNRRGPTARRARKGKNQNAATEFRRLGHSARPTNLLSRTPSGGSDSMSEQRSTPDEKVN